MLTLKFGGTSMADAECISASAKIIIGRAEKDRVSVIASAASGVSNFLQDSIDSCIKGESVEKFVQELKQKHYSICNSLVKLHPDFNIQRVLDKIDGIFTEYEKLLNGVVAFSECPDTIYCRIMGMGELLSNPILEEVLKSEKPVLVDFYADWCGPCNAMAPVIEELAKELEGKVKVGKINVDENPDIAVEYNVMSIPTLIVFKNGKEEKRLVGVQDKEELLTLF